MDSAAIPPGKLPVVTQPYIPSAANLSKKNEICLPKASARNQSSAQGSDFIFC